MKKIFSLFISFVFVFSIIPFVASAQTVSSNNNQTILTNLLEQLLTLYTQELAQLEQQLAIMQTNQITMQAQINNQVTTHQSTSTIIATTTTSTITTSPVYVPSKTLQQIQSVAPDVVQSTTMTSVPSVASSPFIDPYTNQPVYPTTTLWFYGLTKVPTIDNNLGGDHTQSFGVFSSTTPDITTNQYGGMTGPYANDYYNSGIMLNDMVINCLSDIIIGTQPLVQSNYNITTNVTTNSTTTIPLLMWDLVSGEGQIFIRENIGKYTFHNDHGTLEIIMSPSVNSFINETTTAWNEHNGAIITKSITWPMECTSTYQYPFGMEIE
jgi:hypothetical protein